MKTYWITVLILIVGGFITAQTSVEFSAGEGYENGALRNHTDWDATLTYPGNWMVDVEGDGLAWADKVNQRAIWGVANILTGAGDGITFRVEFDCELESMPTTNSLLLFGFIAKPNVGTGPEDNPKMNVIHFKKALLNLQLRNNVNAANLTPDASMPIEDIDDPASTRTLKLAVEISLTLGSDAASSTMSGKIISLTKAKETAVGSYTGISADLFTAATSTGVYGTFGTGSNNAKPAIYKVSMHQMVTSVERLERSENLYSVDREHRKILFKEFSQEEKISIFDISGKKVIEEVIRNHTLDLNKLSAGVYLIKSEKYTGKFVL